MDVAKAWSFAEIAIARPTEAYDRIALRGHKVEHWATDLVVTDERAIDAVHRLLGVDQCQECLPATTAVREEVRERIGPYFYQDGGPHLAEATWAAVHHLQPQTVLETGVARGVSSAFILDALERNGSGELWSIDLPPLGQEWKTNVGSAVSDRLRHRWHYVRGASRRHLPKLLDQLGSLSIFIHDGLHSYSNMKFEYADVWPHLLPRGLLISDDIHANQAFPEFVLAEGCENAIIFDNVDPNHIGIARRP